MSARLAARHLAMRKDTSEFAYKEPGQVMLLCVIYRRRYPQGPLAGSFDTPRPDFAEPRVPAKLLDYSLLCRGVPEWTLEAYYEWHCLCCGVEWGVEDVGIDGVVLRDVQMPVRLTKAELAKLYGIEPQELTRAFQDAKEIVRRNIDRGLAKEMAG